MTLEAAVAVATLRRPVRLRWLLNALYEQDCPGGSFEVVVAHDPGCRETAGVLATHPLRRDGRLRAVPFPAESSLPGAGRNEAWRASRAPLVLFTDDDCRPAPDWVACALAAQTGDDVVVQGRTAPDPDEALILRGAPWAETVLTTPPTPWAEASNIAYPRRLLERLGGFDPRLRVGEDTDLWLRAREDGARLIGAREMVVFHAVHARYLPAAILAAARWRDLAWLVKRHRQARRQMWGRVWWKREHAALTATLAGAILAPVDPRAAGLALPWVALSIGRRGHGARGLLRASGELPGRFLIDAAELAALARGSVRYRTLLL